MLIFVLGLFIVVFRNNISVSAGINTGISLSIQQIINVSISLGDSMTLTS